MIPIKGQPPDLHKEPSYCPFAPRCRFAVDKCFQEIPPLVEAAPEHTTACFRWQDIRAAEGDESKLALLQTVGSPEELKAVYQADEDSEKDVIVKVEGLKQYFPVRRGIMRRTVGYVKAVDGVSFDIYRGETLGLVGESGCGKSTTGMSILQLLEPTAGKVYLNDVELTDLDGNELRETRRHMQMIFQDPYASLNPRKTVGSIVAEGLRIHDIGDKGNQEQRVEALMAMVGLNPKLRQSLPPRIFRRTAATHRHCSCARH